MGQKKWRARPNPLLTTRKHNGDEHQTIGQQLNAKILMPKKYGQMLSQGTIKQNQREEGQTHHCHLLSRHWRVGTNLFFIFIVGALHTILQLLFLVTTYSHISLFSMTCVFSPKTSLRARLRLTNTPIK